jgi:glyoxylase-like metal-dependent hydrolase (beta-lactamase superfamily II)
MLTEISLGNIQIRVVSDGTFSLDGGAMFGIVPKILWQEAIPSDTSNRIELGLNCLLIVTPRHKLLVDTGIGKKLDPKFAEIYAISKKQDLLQSLRDLDVDPDEIDFVINTHLHFDHAGGNTREENGALTTTFPRAQYIIQRGEWQNAVKPDDRTKASYLEENLLPVESSGQLELIDGDCEIVKGVRTLVTGGHTEYHQCVFVEGDGRTLLYLGDLIPTAHHVRVPWVMGYDLYPLDTMKMKKQLMKDALVNDWILAFEHDTRVGLGHLVKQNERLRVEESF